MAALILPPEIKQELTRIAELERHPLAEVMASMLRQYTPWIDPDPDPQLQIAPHEEGWILTWVGKSDILQGFETKEAALEAGKALARSEDVVLLIHSLDGYIEDKFDPDDERTLRPEVEELLWAYQRGEVETFRLEDVLEDLGVSMPTTMSESISIKFSEQAREDLKKISAKKVYDE